ncbi:hypothetical protein OE766_16345 [Pararhizobium sp. YC-54]|uniref:hypothetical protein n=1 Tax=Pararhizobium sp. YC-54 TaxID=2986920 RepID=UPI0021F6E7E6|nr:hypothetical protein [Pararhizobium sp. YC-54]MCV9999811.1 hypothetical protein [Pararhizobium sp. YC-54]
MANERVKLSESSVDRLSTACIAAGFIAPTVSLANGQIAIALSMPLAFSTATWLLTALALHFAARRILGKLQP